MTSVQNGKTVLNAGAGAALLAETSVFLSRFIAYPSRETLLAHTLWVVHTHFMDVWESTPRIAFLSPEPGSGKSRALEVTELLVPNPVHAVNTTAAYLFRKVSDQAGRPTILYDEVDTLFGPRAKGEHEDIRGMLNAGHRKGALAGRCVIKGKMVETEELPAYCAVALAGLDDLPDTLMSRAVVVRMKKRAPNEQVEPFRHRVHRDEGFALRDQLAAWAASQPELPWPCMPDEITDRAADVWEALLAVADAAGGPWPRQARCDAVTLVTAESKAAPSIGVRLLADLRHVFDAWDSLFTEDILTGLVKMDEAPWANLRGAPLDRAGPRPPPGEVRSKVKDHPHWRPDSKGLCRGGPIRCMVSVPGTVCNRSRHKRHKRHGARGAGRPRPQCSSRRRTVLKRDIHRS